MKVLISVLNYNNFLATKNCISSIIKNIREDYELLIVDNNSSDNSFKLIKKQFKNHISIKADYNGGYAYGHRIAARYALKNKFNLIWILNNDLTVRKETLHELLSSLKKHGLGLYGSITLKSENPDIINFGGGDTSDLSKPLDYNSYEGISLDLYKKIKDFRKVQSIEGSSFIIPLEIIKKYGFMREEYFMYGEETDYCYELGKKEVFSYLVPSSVVVHKGAESLKNKKYLEKYYRRRNFILFQKTHYNLNTLKHLSKEIGLINILFFFIKFYIFSLDKDDLYYYNLANLHAIINKYGKLKGS